MPDRGQTQEVILIPVDESGRVLLFSDIKIENVDRDYRTIRTAEGLKWTLTPGKYTVKIFLRDLQMKSVPLTVEPDVVEYRIPVVTRNPVAVENAAEPSSSSQAAENIFQPKAAPGGTKVMNSDTRKRFAVSFPVSYRTDSGTWVNAKTLNVSASGVCVENIARVTEDDNLYVKLHVPAATIPIECPARVVWVRAKGAVPPRMGLQLFLTSNMRDSLGRWLSAI